MNIFSKVRSFVVTSAFLFVVMFSSLLQAAIYEVGPGKTNTELDTVPWLTLTAGDQVLISWRAEPYRTKIGIRGRGTEQQPIVISGVLGPNGEKPIITGDNATTPSSLNGFFNQQWDEMLGTILIKKSSSDSWGYKPGYILFENLVISGGHPSYQYTSQTGSKVNFGNGSAGIWAVLVENLEVKNCDFIDNANGLFVLSKNNAEEETSRNILVEGNLFSQNGISGSYREHNSYIQASDVVYQFNKFERLRPGAEGSTLKDRSSGVHVRYNWIEPSARAIDLVEPEDSFNILTNESNWENTYVYGNYIYHDADEANQEGSIVGSSLIHYGGDSGNTSIYRSGNLYFYNNTYVVNSSQATSWNMRLFDLSTSDQNVVVENNIFYTQGTSAFVMLKSVGSIEFAGKNWLSNNLGLPSSNQLTISGSIIRGDNPGFEDVQNRGLELTASSALIDEGLAINLSLPPLNMQIDSDRNRNGRAVVGANIDLGANEFGSVITKALPKAPLSFIASSSTGTSSDTGNSGSGGTDVGGSDTGGSTDTGGTDSGGGSGVGDDSGTGTGGTDTGGTGGTGSGSSESGGGSGTSTGGNVALEGWTNVTRALSATGSGVRIDIGGGNNDHADLSTFDPGVLTPGSVVNIYHRAQPYNTKLVFHKDGTEANPIIINGVTDASGTRPQINCAGATTQNMQDGNAQWVAPYGCWVLTYSRDGGTWNDPTDWYEFRNLEMYGAGPENTSDGGIPYVNGAAPIRFNEADHIKLIGNIFRDNGNGIFIASGNRANGDFQIQGNKFIGNGVVGSYLEHNLYFQAVSDRPFSNVVEGNYFGPLRSGAIGNSSMKHRGTDLIFRYNTVICSQRCLDLVEVQDSLPNYVFTNFSAQEILDRYRTSYVYGNQFWADDTRGYTATYGIHVGMDTGTAHPTDDQLFSSNSGAAENHVMARGYQSPVYFYNNSYYANNASQYFQSIFDGDAGSSGPSRHTVEIVAANNVIHFADTVPANQVYASHMRMTGQLTYQAKNLAFISGSAYATLNEGRDNLTSDDPDITIIGGASPTLTQGLTGIDPLFTDVSNADVEQISLKLQAGSSAIGQGGTLPFPMSNYPVLLQPVLAVDGGGAVTRASVNNLGAFE